MEEEFNGRLSSLTGDDQSDEMYDLTSCSIIGIVACLFTVVHSDSCFDFAAVREDVERWMDETREAREVGHSAAKAEGGERRTSESFSTSNFEIRGCCRLHLTTLLHLLPPSPPPSLLSALQTATTTTYSRNHKTRILLSHSQERVNGGRLQRSAQIEKTRWTGYRACCRRRRGWAWADRAAVLRR